MELWYLECLRRWVAHHGRSPVIRELSAMCKKSKTAVQSALVALEWKKCVTRVGGDGDDARRFVLTRRGEQLLAASRQA